MGGLGIDVFRGFGVTVPVARGMVAALQCAVCGSGSGRVELVAPGQLPAAWARWGDDTRAVFNEYHDAAKWRLLFEGIEAGNGLGSDLSQTEAERIANAFEQPYNYESIHQVGFYDDAGYCGPCDLPYCYEHWGAPVAGYGHCPNGHGKSLDPHWSPD
jgi:hypothetical protein